MTPFVFIVGTGSGSMSHALARTVAPGGRVHTFDFHEHRAQLARQEFEEHGLGEVVRASHRDVCQDGFGIEGVADAVFLDLPHPWEAVDAAARALNRDTGQYTLPISYLSLCQIAIEGGSNLSSPWMGVDVPGCHSDST